MRYVQEVLQPGEKILFASTIHWLVYAPGAALIVVVLVLAFSGMNSASAFLWQTAAFFVLLAALFSLIGAWFRRWTTEIAVTDRRVIYKRGFIRRRTIEMNMEKVESVDVSQSIPGRIFNYGDVLIRGVGVGFEPLRMVDDPIQLRNAVTAK